MIREQSEQVSSGPKFKVGEVESRGNRASQKCERLGFRELGSKPITGGDNGLEDIPGGNVAADPDAAVYPIQCNPVKE